MTPTDQQVEALARELETLNMQPNSSYETLARFVLAREVALVEALEQMVGAMHQLGKGHHGDVVAAETLLAHHKPKELA